MHGIDVSNNNAGAVSFAGQDFAWLKVSEATTFVDQTFAEFSANARAAGVPFGGYHFAHPDQHSAAEEAAWFLEHYQPRGTIPAALDLEPRGVGAQHRDPLVIMGAPALASWADAWCAAVLDGTGLEPVQYMDRDYCAHLSPYSHRWPLWLATGDGSKPANYAGRTVAVVQYGIANGVDQDEGLAFDLGEFWMALTDEEQTELLAIVRAMGVQNWQAPSMSLQWLDDHVDQRLTAAIPAIAKAVAAEVGSGAVSGAVEVSGTVQVTEPPPAPSAAAEPASEPAAAPEAAPAPAPAPAPETAPETAPSSEPAAPVVEAPNP